MSKIAENRVKELGYSKDPLNRAEYTANDLFNACVECYDQALCDIKQRVKEIINHQEKEWGKQNVDIGLYTIWDT